MSAASSEFTYLGAADREASRSRSARRRVRASSITSISATIQQAPWPSFGITAEAAAPWLRVVRDTRNHEIESVALAKPEEAGGDAARCSRAGAVPPCVRRRHRSDAQSQFHLRRQRLCRGTRAIRWLRRCSPTASGWSAARSNITGRAASSAPAPKSRMRWSSCATVRGASRIRARPCIELYDGLDAASQNRWPSLKFDVQSINGLMSAVLRRRLLLQDLHVAGGSSGSCSTSPLIRRSRRAWPRGDANRTPTITRRPSRHCDVLVIGGGPAGPHGGADRGRAPARASSSPRRISCSAGGSSRSGSRSTASRHADWLRGRRQPSYRGLDNVTLMPRTTVFGVYDGGTYGAVQRVADHVQVPGEHQPRQRSLAHRGEARRACLRRHRARHRLRRQRSARRDAGLGGAQLSQPLRCRRRARAPLCSPAHDDGWTHGARSRGKPASPWLPWSIRAARASRSRVRGPWPIFAGAVVKEARGGRQLKSVVVRDDKGAETEIACDLLAVSDGWNPTLHLTCHLGGKPAWQEALAAFVPGSCRQGMRRGRRRGWALSTLAEALEDGARLGAEAAERSRLRRAGAGDAAGRRRRSASAAPLWWVHRRQGCGLRRFAERRHHQGHRARAAREAIGASEHVKRYTTLGMAHRPGQDRRMSTALGVSVGADRRADPQRSAPRASARPIRRSPAARSPAIIAARISARKRLAAVASLGLRRTARCSPMPGCGSGAMVSAASRRGPCSKASTREAAAVRAARSGVCDVSTLGKIDVQGPDAGDAARPRLRQHILDADSRPGAATA